MKCREFYLNERSRSKEQIRRIMVEELKQMRGQEGLILQGCGGKPQEWLDGINELLMKENILLDGSRFESCLVFEYEGLTNILFLFGEEKLSIGKLAMWRIASYSVFGGTWLSDYLDHKFGCQEQMEDNQQTDVDNKMDFS